MNEGIDYFSDNTCGGQMALIADPSDVNARAEGVIVDSMSIEISERQLDGNAEQLILIRLGGMDIQ